MSEWVSVTIESEPWTNSFLIWCSPIFETYPEREFSLEYFTENLMLLSYIFVPSMVKYNILSNNRRSKLHTVIDCLFFANLSSFMNCAVVPRSECCCTLGKTLYMIRQYHGRGSQSGCRNLLPKIFNQNQLESILECMTLSLPVTSLEDGRHSQSISHKLVTEHVRETTVHLNWFYWNA